MHEFQRQLDDFLKVNIDELEMTNPNSLKHHEIDVFNSKTFKKQRTISLKTSDFAQFQKFSIGDVNKIIFKLLQIIKVPQVPKDFLPSVQIGFVFCKNC